MLEESWKKLKKLKKNRQNGNNFNKKLENARKQLGKS